MSYQAERYIKNLIYATTIAAILFVIRRQWNFMGVSDACALSGICFLILALFRRARYMRFYDLFIYGAMRFKSLRKNPEMTDKTFGSYGEFVEKRQYEKNYMESFIAAVSMFVCSFAVLGI